MDPIPVLPLKPRRALGFATQALGALAAAGGTWFVTLLGAAPEPGSVPASTIWPAIHSAADLPSAACFALCTLGGLVAVVLGAITLARVRRAPDRREQSRASRGICFAIAGWACLGSYLYLR